MEQIWWGHVPNAIRFIQDIKDQLLEERSLILTCKGMLPWYDDATRMIMDEVRQYNADKLMEQVEDIDDPGLYIREEYCNPLSRAGYRPSKGAAAFLAETDDATLHQRYLWVKVRTSRQMEGWSRFVSQYVARRDPDKERAAFVLEWVGEGDVPAANGVPVYSFDGYITPYDRIVFCTLVTSDLSGSSYIKNYLTELTASVAGNDIELVAKCLQNRKEFMKRPYETICRIVQEETRSDGTPFVFRQDRKAVERLVWRAQIKTVYPVIEEYREEFAERHAAEIKRLLPIKNDYGERYDEPGDVEIGMLKYMADNRRIQTTEGEMVRLTMFRNARNALSHLTPLTIEQVRNLET